MDENEHKEEWCGCIDPELANLVASKGGTEIKETEQVCEECGKKVFEEIQKDV